MRKLIGATLVAVLCLVAWVGAREGGEQKVPLDKVPKAILDNVKTRFPGAKLLGASSEKEDGKVVYEIELTYKDLHHDVTYAANGTLILIERAIAFKNLPKVVRTTLEKEYPKATYKIIEEVIKVAGGKEMLDFYEAHLQTADKKTIEVEILPNGKIKKPAAKPELKK